MLLLRMTFKKRLRISPECDILFRIDFSSTGSCRMTDMEQRAAARQFVANWTRRGDEKQETQSF